MQKPGILLPLYYGRGIWMLIYDTFRFMFGNLSAEQRLQVLRPESKRYFSAIQGYTQLLQHRAEQGRINEDPDEIQLCLQKVIVNTTELKEIVLALTGGHDSYGREELRPYTTLFEAIVAIAKIHQLALDPSILIVHMHYPLVLRWDKNGEGQCRVELLENGYKLVLYKMEVRQQTSYWQESLVDEVSSLENVVEKLSSWLPK